MGKIRTFVAVDISGAAESLAAKTIKDLQPVAGDYRWTESATRHMTLNFLGDIHEREIPDVCRCVEKAVRGISEFSISFGGLGAFPRAERPRVLWLGVSEGREALLGLQAVLAKRLDEDMGFPPDRTDFCPHLTLGRANHSNAWTEELLQRVAAEPGPRDPSAVSFVDEVIVYSSHMDKGGLTYTPMATIELK